MGCAGMSGMEEAVKAGALLSETVPADQRDITVVDGVKAGVEILLQRLRATA